MNPVVVMADGVIAVIVVGSARTVVVVPMTVPVLFVAVIINAHDVPNPVNDVNVAVPVEDEDGLATLPLMVYVVMTDVPIPPDHVTTKPVVVMADGVILEIGDTV